MFIKTFENKECRGKSVENDQWVYGDYAYSQITQKHYIHRMDEFKTEVYEKTIGQYTGSNDCLRSEEYPFGYAIFSGDIVKFYLWNLKEENNEDDFVYALVTNTQKSKYSLAVDGYSLYNIMEWNPEQMLVVGNQFDNPELLKHIWTIQSHCKTSMNKIENILDADVGEEELQRLAETFAMVRIQTSIQQSEAANAEYCKFQKNVEIRIVRALQNAGYSRQAWGDMVEVSFPKYVKTEKLKLI